MYNNTATGGVGMSVKVAADNSCPICCDNYVMGTLVAANQDSVANKTPP